MHLLNMNLLWVLFWAQNDDAESQRMDYSLDSVVKICSVMQILMQNDVTVKTGL